MYSKLYFIFGPMNCGKSMHLLSKAYNFEERNIPFLVLKPKIDDRDGENVIHSRALGDRECVSVEENTNVYELVKEEMLKQNKHFKWILVDESQFLTPKQVDQLSNVVDNFGSNVMCYGLRTDFKTNLFPGSKRLLEISDSLEELKCSCSCGNKAIYNARIDFKGNIVTDGEQVEIGGNDKYISMCRKCYKEKIKEIN